MNNTNSLISQTIPLTSVVPGDLFLKITSDGIQDIPLSFSEIPIDFFISVASPCSTLAHYTSGYLTDVVLNTHCIVLTNQYSASTESFSVSTECRSFSGNFLKGTMSVFASAMSGIGYHQVTDECACNLDEITDWTRNTSANTSITVTGVFDVNGMSQTLSGTSNYFDLVPNEDFFMIKKQNENRTLVDRMKRLVVDENLKNSADYWVLTEGMYGSDITSLNYALPEKVANFAENQKFVDTMNYRIIKKTKSLFGESFQSFEIENIPDNIDRLVNIGSIETSKLFGHKCKCNMNFQSDGNCGTTECGRCKQVKTVNNLGDSLNSESVLSAGVPILYKSNSDKNYTVLYPTVQDGLSSYSLGSLTAQNVFQRTDVCYYEWDQTPQENIVGNLLTFGTDPDNRTRLMRDDEEDWDAILDENLLLDLHRVIL